MRDIFYYIAIGLFIIACSSTSRTTTKNNANVAEEEVRIANDSLEYEIIIFDIGFNYYLNSVAKPDWYYSQSYLESKNRFYVTEWNIRVHNPFKYDDSIYEQEINYDFFIDYGLEVNYKLFNYFKFVEQKYGQKFY